MDANPTYDPTVFNLSDPQNQWDEFFSDSAPDNVLISDEVNANPIPGREESATAYHGSTFSIPDIASGQPELRCSSAIEDSNLAFDGRLTPLNTLLIPDQDIESSTPSSSTLASSTSHPVGPQGKDSEPAENFLLANALPPAHIAIPSVTPLHRCAVCRRTFGSAARLE